DGPVQRACLVALLLGFGESAFGIGDEFVRVLLRGSFPLRGRLLRRLPGVLSLAFGLFDDLFPAGGCRGIEFLATPGGFGLQTLGLVVGFGHAPLVLRLELVAAPVGGRASVLVVLFGLRADRRGVLFGVVA